MFVNDFTLDVGNEGQRAIRFLLETASRQENIPIRHSAIFWDEDDSSFPESKF